MLFICCLLLGLFSLSAQHYNIWTFSTNNILDFKTEPPTLFKGGYPISEYYPTTNICDSLGNLIAYTKGGSNLFLFDASNQKTPHSRLMVKNDIVTYNAKSQSSFFVPKGKMVHQYLFLISNISMDCLGKNSTDSFMFLFDHHLNAGKGDLVDSNAQPTNGVKSLTHLTFTRHPNDSEYWIIGKSFDTLCVLRSTSSGISMVNKTLDEDINNPVFVYQNAAISGLSKFSNQGNKFACLTFTSNMYDFRKGDSVVLAIFNFDRSTGTISNKKVLFKEAVTNQTYLRYKDLCFSPNDSFLYFSFNDEYLHASEFNRFLRYSIYTNRIDTIPIPNFGGITNLQTGPNNKLYFLSYTDQNIQGHPDSRLGCVFNPNEANAAKIKISSQLIDTSFNATLYNSLPQHDQYEFTQFTYSIQQNCSVKFTNLAPPTFAHYKWYFGDGDSSEVHSPVHSYARHGVYFVKLAAIKENGFIIWFSDSVIVPSIMHASIGTTDSVGCAWIAVQFNDSSALDSFNQNYSTFKWQWDFGDFTTDTNQHPKHIYTQSGKYHVTLKVSSPYCEDTTSMKKEILILPAPKAGFTLNKKLFCMPPAPQVSITDTVETFVKTKSYEFSDGNPIFQASPYEHHFSYAFNYPGEYNIIQHLVGTSGCEATDTQYIRIFNTLKSFKPSPPTVTIHNQYPLLYWDKNTDALTYSIFKGSNFSSLLHYTTTTDTFLLDTYNINPSINTYQYALQLKDNCDTLSLAGNSETTILLKGTAQLNQSAQLNWNNITLTLNQFQVQKQIGNTWVSFPTSQLNFLDNAFYVDSLRSMTYQIETQNTLGRNVRSNEIALPYQPDIFIPSYGNADLFPNGIPIFPYLLSNFEIEFFNMIGQSVWKETNATVFMHSNPVTQYYIYQVVGTDIFGKAFTKRGKILSLF